MRAVGRAFCLHGKCGLVLFVWGWWGRGGAVVWGVVDGVYGV